MRGVELDGPHMTFFSSALGVRTVAVRMRGEDDKTEETFQGEQKEESEQERGERLRQNFSSSLEPYSLGFPPSMSRGRFGVAGGEGPRK